MDGEWMQQAHHVTQVNNAHGGWLYFEKVFAEGDCDGFGAVCRADLLQNGVDVDVHAVLPYSQLLGDVAVGQSTCH